MWIIAKRDKETFLETPSLNLFWTLRTIRYNKVIILCLSYLSSSLLMCLSSHTIKHPLNLCLTESFLNAFFYAAGSSIFFFLFSVSFSAFSPFPPFYKPVIVILCKLLWILFATKIRLKLLIYKNCGVSYLALIDLISIALMSLNWKNIKLKTQDIGKQSFCLCLCIWWLVMAVALHT